MKEPKLGEPLHFTTIKEWQEANKRANELGLKGFIEYLAPDLTNITGKWVKLETSSKRS